MFKLVENSVKVLGDENVKAIIPNVPEFKSTMLLIVLATEIFNILIIIIPQTLKKALKRVAFLKGITLVPTNVQIAFGASVIAFVNISIVITNKVIIYKIINYDL